MACICYSTYLILVQHACVQFSVLILNIRQPFGKYNFADKTLYDEINQEDWIVDIITRYLRITKFVELINNLSRIIYLVGISFSMVLIFFNVLYILQLFTILQSASETFECIIVIIGSLFSIYINFYIGQMLINHNRAAFEELCHVPFYMIPIKIQKMMLFIIARSMRPCELSIGGIFVASHEIFAGLLQKAFSFAIVYYNRYN
ncbi:uncharacterized protein LOC124953537 [Vespa velutina]|uniref:uncharacterized protein LOC124953537 n=1 Tax=Vespa velutina TaxID=202808 RepID=UPI001FB4EFF0|nr:uncharacterized protein LOC124953537 [Vespa velutina]